MTEDLAHRGLRDADCDRVREAFAKLGPTLQRWPTARMVLETLPAAQPPHQALPRPTPDMEKVAAGIAGMRRSKKRLRSVFLPGESLADYQHALAVSPLDKESFDVERLRENGL